MKNTYRYTILADALALTVLVSIVLGSAVGIGAAILIWTVGSP